MDGGRHAKTRNDHTAHDAGGGGRRYLSVRRVTRNTVMADVTGDQDRIRPGDEVVLFGRRGDEIIAQKELETNASPYGSDLLSVFPNPTPLALRRRGPKLARDLHHRDRCIINHISPVTLVCGRQTAQRRVVAQLSVMRA